MSDWQRIGTAPQDGTPLLLWPRHPVRPRVFTVLVGRWHNGAWSGPGLKLGHAQFLSYFSHWMRPPPGPVDDRICAMTKDRITHDERGTDAPEPANARPAERSPGTTVAARPKLTEIANRIHAHLKRFETDPKINKTSRKYGTTPYYWAQAAQVGRYVLVSYVTYQGHTALTREQAEAYLAWLDAGNVGRHFEARRVAESRNAQPHPPSDDAKVKA